MEDNAILSAGMKALIKAMGIVDAQRFIALIIRKPFGYTEWQKDLFDDMSVKELSEKAMKYVNTELNK